jgi:hypothetical protein
MNDLKDTIDKTLAVAPASDAGERAEVPARDGEYQGGRGDAGKDDSIRERMEKDPESRQARLDHALDESMDASDPPATTQPIHNHGPAPSSGYDEAAERARQD